ncbi:hypothetical protein KEM55_001911 [Ascosphaera atra]|nr:hypothetical protein KEM55_001911 [Ascosphaera atra]
MVVPKQLLQALHKVQCRIFEHTFNPEGKRLGNKVLRQRLRGPALAAYYPRKTVSFRDLQDIYKPIGLETVHEEEAARLAKVEFAKSRGKGAPTKKNSAEVATTTKHKPTKNQLRRARKKAAKQATATNGEGKAESQTPQPQDEQKQEPAKKPEEKVDEEKKLDGKPDEKSEQPSETGKSDKKDDEPTEDDFVQEVEPAPYSIDPSHPLYDMFRGVISKFGDHEEEKGPTAIPEKPEVFFDDDDIPDEEAEEQNKLSKKKRKEMNKISVAELKSMVKKPELVEWTDADAQDPKLLVHLKSYRNVVPVPGHWSLKREYLSSKRGVEKQPFSLPKFIQETGITEMRDAALERQEQQSLKQKQRERVQPKMGRLDIDYQKLYEAFFRFQTKPELTRFGEIYYEGKEYETNLRHLRPS